MNEPPVYITGDITNACNSRCAICYLTYLKERPRPDFMSAEHLDVICKKLAPYKGALSLSCCFEPLLHPEAARLIELSGFLTDVFDIRLNTNAIGLTKDVANALIRAKLDAVVISLDSATAALNQIIRGNQQFDTIVNNVEHLVQLRAVQSVRQPRISLRMVLHKLNLPELVPLVQLTLRLGVDELYVQFLAPVAHAVIGGVAADQLLLNAGCDDVDAVFREARQEVAGSSMSLVLPTFPKKVVTGKSIWKERKTPYADKNGFHIQSNGSCRVSVYNLDIHGNPVKDICGNIFEDSVEDLLIRSHELRHPAVNTVE